MHYENITRHEFRKMEEYIPDNGLRNTECKLFILKNKDKWNKKYKLFKDFTTKRGIYFKNKIQTIDRLIEKQEQINISELIMPIELMAVGNDICGYTMPYIENINVNKLLNSNIDNKKKIKILKEIGMLLERIIETKLILPGDIHEGNFIYNKETGKINMVDIDSVCFKDSEPATSKYLSFNNNLYGFHKYPVNDSDRHYANKNTVYLSYIYMILNYISGIDFINCVRLQDYYRYLKKLRDNGLSDELVDIFSNIYSEAENKNPVDLLDEIPDDIKRLSYRGF